MAACHLPAPAQELPSSGSKHALLFSSTGRGHRPLMKVKHGLDLYEEAVRLHEEHAQHAREHGREAMARRAEERAERAKIRADFVLLRALSTGIWS
jgi:hypothetical protein